MSYQPVWFDGREPQLSPADLDLARIDRTHAELTASGHVVVDTMTASGFQAVYYKQQSFGQQSLEARYKSGLITDQYRRRRIAKDDSRNPRFVESCSRYPAS